MAITKKPCINDATFTYTGKEMSPLGLGYCANAEKVGHFMKGKDNTMWMVGMKNGVKVWNRVPNELANAPLQKEEPVLQEVVLDEAGPSEPPPAPKKKAAPRKKATTVEKEESENEDVAKELFTEETAEREESKEEVKVVEDTEDTKPAKKKAAPRKRSPKPTTEEKGSDDTASEGKKEKKTRKPTDFNMFMKYRMMHMSKDIKHKDKFQMAAKEWKQLDAEAKKEIMEKVHAEFST